MLSSNFFLCAVISWTQVLLSRFHNLDGFRSSHIFKEHFLYLPDTAIVASADKIQAVLVHGEAGDAVEVGHHAVHHLARVVVIEPDVSVLMPRDGQGQRGVGQHGIDGPHWLTRHRVLAGVQLHHHSGRLGVIDDRRGVAEADHELAQVPGDPVAAGGDTALLGLAQGGHQALAVSPSSLATILPPGTSSTNHLVIPLFVVITLRCQLLSFQYKELYH